VPVTDELDVPVIVVPEGDLEQADSFVGFEGTAPASAEVVVYDNDVPLHVVVADGRGWWQFDPPEPLTRGTHVVVARTTDGARVSRPSAPVRVVVVVESLPLTGGDLTAAGGQARDALSFPRLSLLLGLVLVCACLVEGLFFSRRAR
jgi:hypothetical protein